MAFNITVLNIEEEFNEADVTYEDTSSGLTFTSRIPLPEEYADEDELLDYLVTTWPYEVFTQRGKPQNDRNKEAKKVLNNKKNVTGRVNQGRP